MTATATTGQAVTMTEPARAALVETLLARVALIGSQLDPPFTALRTQEEMSAYAAELPQLTGWLAALGHWPDHATRDPLVHPRGSTSSGSPQHAHGPVGPSHRGRARPR